MFYKDIITIIKNYQIKGSRYGLKSTRDLLNALGSPDDKLKIIHVAGTNGKGSTCEYLTQILCSAGKKVGTYTSPEVFDYAEKFKVDGKFLPEQKLKEYLSYVYEISLNFEIKPTAFEIETVAALYAFYKEGCEYCVLECGLGGLSDSTNAVNKKEVAVILSVGLEHTALLGDTITEICKQKAGIIKNCPAIVSAHQHEEGLAYFKEQNVCFAGENITPLTANLGGQSFIYKGQEYKINMLGRAQLYNAATAIDVAKYLQVADENIKDGLIKAKLLGRVEIINKAQKTFILDGSHNPDSFAPLTEILQNINVEKELIYGCLSDKDADGAARILSKKFKTVFAVSPQNYRGMEIEKIVTALSGRFESVIVKPDIKSAISATNTQCVVICGTFTVLKEAKQWIEKEQ